MNTPNPVVEDERTAINWYQKLRGVDIGVVYDPQNRRGQRDIDYKTKTVVVFRFNDSQPLAIQNVAHLLSLFPYIESEWADADAAVFSNCVCDLSGIGCVVCASSIMSPPPPFDDELPYVQTLFGVGVECSIAKVRNGVLTFYSTELLWGDLGRQALFFRIELDFNSRLVRVCRIASTLRIHVPIPFLDKWISVEDFDKFWLSSDYKAGHDKPGDVRGQPFIN
jgi:hypothetical protein